MAFDNFLYKAQAEEITKLKEHIEELRRKYEPLRQAAYSWDSLVRQANTNPVVKAAWEDFLLVLSIGSDEAYLKKMGAQ